MKRIIIYISDHGFGHAARIIGLVRQLTNVEVIIKNSIAYQLLKKSLPQVRIIDQKTDVGPTFDWKLNKIDIERTFSDYKKLILAEDKWIQKEIEFVKANPPNLIISDISPLALRLAKKIKCNVISISNFSWVDILENLQNVDEHQDVLKWLEDSFSLSDLTIKLPLSMNLKGFSNIQEANLLCRDATDTEEGTLKKLGLKAPPVVIYLGNARFDNLVLQQKDNIDLVMMTQDRIFLNKTKLPNVELEGQNLISSSILVISKIGYSVLSEGLKFCKPMLLISRTEYPEDNALRIKVKPYSISQTLTLQDNKTINIPTLDQIQKMKRRINIERINTLFAKQDAKAIIEEFIAK